MYEYSGQFFKFSFAFILARKYQNYTVEYIYTSGSRVFPIVQSCKLFIDIIIVYAKQTKVPTVQSADDFRDKNVHCMQFVDDDISEGYRTDAVYKCISYWYILKKK